MEFDEKVKKILELFDQFYPTDDKCYLNYEEDWQLLIATILSAQCTDDRVNSVTEDLFKKYKTIDDFANAKIEILEQDIKSTGFYRNKAKNIISACRMLVDKYNYKMPSDVEELTNLPGVGRKTANVVRSHIFNLPSIVVDTHVKRISKKLGLTKSNDPVKIEFVLMDIFPEEHWIRYNTQAIAHGRKICKARSPKCDECGFFDVCDTRG